MTSISWLHLTDLHIGMPKQKSPLLSMQDKLFEDMKELYDKCGSWDLVFFTGDLTNKGLDSQFKNFNDNFLEKLNQYSFSSHLKSEPLLLFVPGNHDLVRPQEINPSELEGAKLTKANQHNDALTFFNDFWNQANEDKRNEFWSDENSKYRKFINEIFSKYSTWWNNHKLQDSFKEGILPGDFSYTLTTKEGIKLGIIGLNTAFLQISDGNYERKLALNSEQFHKVCGGDVFGWKKQHDACILLTHHPIEWLHDDCQEEVREIISNKFLHLCGHLHEAEYEVFSKNGTYGQQKFQGRALFGREKFGNQVQRLHGYSLGMIEFSTDNNNSKKRTFKKLIFWPREARKQGDLWKIVQDYAFNLDGYISPQSIDSIQKEFEQIEQLKILHEKMQKLAVALVDLRGHIPRRDKGYITSKDKSIVKDKWNDDCYKPLNEFMEFIKGLELTGIDPNSGKPSEISEDLKKIQNLTVRDIIREKARKVSFCRNVTDDINKLKGISSDWEVREYEKDRLTEFLEALQPLDSKINDFLDFVDKKLKEMIDKFSQEKLSELKQNSKFSESFSAYIPP